MCKLVVTRKGKLESHTEALMDQLKASSASTHLDAHYRHTANERADGDVDHGVLLSILGDHLVDHVQREDGDKGHIEEEGWPSTVTAD